VAVVEKNNMAQKPIGYYGEFRPTGVDQSAARRFEALAGLADQVGDIAFQIGAKRAEKIGAEKGEKAGRAAAERLAKPQPEVGPPEDVEPPKTKEGFLASMSIEAQAYNAAMKSAYFSQVSTDAKEQVERIAAQYPDDVQAFQSNIQQYSQGLLQGVSDEFKESAEATIANYIANAETAVFKNQVAKNRAIANSSRQLAINLHNDESAKMARDGDPDQAIVNQQHHDLVIDSMVVSGDLAADDAQIAKDSLAKRIQQQTQLGELERVIFDENLSTREQYEKGVAFVERIRDAELEDIGPEDKDKLLSVLDSKIESLRVGLSREESEISVEQGRVISDLMIAASTGSRPSEEIVEEANQL
jgi:polyhydroxyalkanoate synthesis regulator phasin